MTSQLLDRVYGCLIGGAVGDSMGFATEGMHYRAIRRRYGKVEEPRVRENGAGMHPPVTTNVYTDDTVMKHMVCEAILAAGGHPRIEDIADVWRRTITDYKSWVWWLNTRVVAAKLQFNPLLPLREIGRDSIPCNDAAMIIGPIGLINAGDPRGAALEAWDISALWQNGYSRECAAGMAAAHAEAVTPGATVDSIISAARTHAPVLAPYIDKTMALTAECSGAEEFTERFYAEQLHFPNEEFWTPPDHPDPEWSFGADPLEVCTEALAFFALSQGDGRSAVIGSINFGRDCDTIAGIAAALCGALNGSSVIPADWCRTVIAANPSPDIRSYAQCITQVITEDVSGLAKRAEKLGSYL